MTPLKRILNRLSPARILERRRERAALAAAAGRAFQNPDIFLAALEHKAAGTAVLHTRDGLRLTIRQNLWDARIVQEIFLEEPYTRGLALGPRPVVVDIGGYIGDFSLFAAERLGAGRVVVYEPTAENFALLTQNIADNGLGDRVTAVNAAVGLGGGVTLNVEVGEAGEVHASAHLYPEAERRCVPSVTLEGLLAAHGLSRVDLLKIDCEGGEYGILGAAPEDLFSRIENIVFEHHRIDGYEEKLRATLARLHSAGYRVRRQGLLVWATRAQGEQEP